MALIEKKMIHHLCRGSLSLLRKTKKLAVAYDFVYRKTFFRVFYEFGTIRTLNYKYSLMFDDFIQTGRLFNQ